MQIDLNLRLVAFLPLTYTTRTCSVFANSEGIEAYKLKIDPFFTNLRNHNFATIEHAIDFLQATFRVTFVHKASQDPSVPEPFRKEMLTCYQSYCAELNANATYMTTVRWNVLETDLCQRCAAAQVVMIFDSKVPYEKARSLQTTAAPATLTTSASPTGNLTSDTTALLVLGKTIETLNLRLLPPSTDRGGFDRGRPEARAASDSSCFWCGTKGHSMMVCPVPAPNHAVKLARDEVLAARGATRARDLRNSDRRARRLWSAASSVVSDGENDVDGDMTDTFAKIQALMSYEPTKD